MTVLEGRAIPTSAAESETTDAAWSRRPLPSLPASWPIFALLVLYPLWWALGMGTIIYPLLAVPMTVGLLRRRPIKVPPGFGLWLLFLLWFVASVSMLGYDPPRTYGGVDLSRVIAIGTRFVEYGSVTIAMLYVGNLSERELSRARLVRMLGVLFLVTVIGGLVGLLWPRFEFTSPVELLLPDWMRHNLYVQSLVHPAVAQLQQVLGHPTPRPAAPFGYTNTWGNCLSVLLVWFAVGWFVYGSQLRRTVGVIALGVAMVPVVYSVNRGLWIALVLSGLYLGLRLAARGKLWALGALSSLLVVGTVMFVASPLHTVVEERLEHPKSNDIRTFTSVRTLEAAAHSPVLGYGNTRDALGGTQSIAIGKSTSCQRCGNPTLGSNGQLWLVLISQGYVGAALYASFFAFALLRYARDPTPIGMAGVLVLLLALLYMFVYNALVTPLSLYLLSLALLWRNDVERQRMASEAVPRRGRAHRRLERSVS